MNEELDAHLNRLVAEGAVPQVAGLVCRADEVLYEGAAGDSGLGGPMNSDIVGAIMSMTKAVTGVAAMQLVEQGRLSLDAPAGEVCPYLSEVQVLEGYTAAGDPVLRPPRSPVTLRNLLTHSSGFVYEIWNDTFADYLQRSATPSIVTLRKAALRVPLMFDPDSRWEYGIGIDWAGQMVEAVSGQTLGEYFGEHITGPLGMHSTAFTPTDDMLARKMSISIRTDDGFVVPPEEDAPSGFEPEFEMGGGGLLSTVRDYGRFVRMLLGGGQLEGTRILEAETVAQMASNQMGDLRVTPLPTSAPEMSCDAEFFPGDEKSWGLTFQINETPTWTGRPAGTLMWAGLANSYFWVDLTNDLAGVFMSQFFPFADPGVVNGLYQFEKIIYDSFNR